MDEKPASVGTTPCPGTAASVEARRRLRTAGSTGVGLALAVASVASTASGAHAEQNYTVRRGDTVSHIAQQTGSSIAAIVRANNLTSRAFIRAGQHLTIPGSATAPAATRAAPPAAAAHYTVRAGDTLSQIAARHGTTVVAIATASRLANPGFIRIGQELTVPGAGGAASPAPTSGPAAPAATYTVRAGDTASAIAAKYRTTIRAIAAANHLANPSFIRIGQQLTIPGVATPAGAPGGELVGNTFAGRTYPQATVDSANQNRAKLLAHGVPSKARMQAFVVATARKLRVNAALAQAVAYQESGFNQAAVSPANAIGTMQVIPSSGRWASDLVGRPLNLLDPRDNVTAGVVILHQLVHRSPDLATALAGYYQGAASVQKYGMFADTRVYVANVQTLMARFA